MKAIRKTFVAFVAIVLSPVAAHAYLISVDARAGVRGGAGEIDAFAELDGPVSKLVQANSSEASAFAEADLGARTVRTFNTSTTEGFSDAYAEFSDIYFITGVADDILSVDIGMSVSFEGAVETDGLNFNAGRLLGRAGQFQVDTPFTTGGTFATGGIQTFDRLIGGGFNRIDILMLIDSIALFGAGTVNFSGTGSVDFDLSFLPAGASLVSQSGFTVNAATTVPEPGTLTLLGIGLLGFAISRRRVK